MEWIAFCIGIAIIIGAVTMRHYVKARTEDGWVSRKSEQRMTTVEQRLADIERRLTDIQEVMISLNEKFDRWEEERIKA